MIKRLSVISVIIMIMLLCMGCGSTEQTISNQLKTKQS